MENAALRRQAILALSRKSTKTAFLRICAVLKNDPSPVIRHEAAFLLGATKNKEAIIPLINAINKDDSDLVRHEAIEALGDLGFKDNSIIKLLTSLKKDRNPFIIDTADIALKILTLKR